jgi:hypothetical protein
MGEDSLSEDAFKSRKAKYDVGGDIGVSAIGDNAIVVTGDHNIHYFEGNIAGRDVQISEVADAKVISDEQAFERIGAAVRLNLKQLEKNIEQARKESSQFFRLTLIFASVGFLVVIIGIILLFSEQVTAGIVSTASSIIPEVTAFLFFTKDKELRKTISAYHQHMLNSQQLLTMVDVAETIIDTAEKDRIKQQIIAKVLGFEPLSKDPK